MAAYPGEGYKMSNYGLKTYSAEQIKLQWKKAVEREIKVKVGEPVRTLTELYLTITDRKVSFLKCCSQQ